MKNQNTVFKFFLERSFVFTKKKNIKKLTTIVSEFGIPEIVFLKRKVSFTSTLLLIDD